MAELEANDFTAIPGKPNEWLHPDGVTRYVTRPGQTLEEFLAELAAEDASGEPQSR